MQDSMPDVSIFVPSLLIFYYLAARQWIRNQSEPGATVIQYTPPGDLSPAAIRYALAGTLDPRGVAANVVYLAARGLVTFQGLDEYYVILRTAEPPPPDLPQDELAAYKTMFNLDKGGTAPLPGRLRTYNELPKDAYLLAAVEGKELDYLAGKISECLRKANREPYFNRNAPYSVFAAMVSVYAICSNIGDPTLRWCLTLTMALGLPALNISGGLPELLRGNSNPENRAKASLLIILAVILWLLGVFANPGAYAFQFALLLVIFLNLTLPLLLHLPTAAGRKLLDEIEGYREFLGSVELDRMYRLKSPGWKPSPATANLAYAIALDLGDAWDEYLANAGFRTVVWQRNPTGGFPRKREIRTGPDNAWVDHWSGWVAFAVLMVVVGCFATLLTHVIGP
jgi:hypothetical protein